LQPPPSEVAGELTLGGQRSGSLTALPKPQPPPASAPSTSPALPRSGNLLWAGRLERRGIVEIHDDRASVGFVRGKLPGVPIRLRVFPGDLKDEGMVLYSPDAKATPVLPGRPGPENGWNATRFVSDARKAGAIEVLEAPNADNGWTRLTVRNNDASSYAVLVIVWERL
jgi:hypothetical protein